MGARSPHDSPASPDTRAAAREALDEIALDIWNAIQRSSHPPPPTLTVEAALFFSYLAAALDDAEHRGRAEHCCDLAARAPRSAFSRPGLFQGLVEIGWVLAHVPTVARIDAGEDARSRIHEVVSDALDAGWEGSFDLVKGLAGWGVYALERGERGQRCLGQVIDRLAETALTEDGGTWWLSDPSWLGADTREASPDGHFDLGVAHGIAGVLPVLAGAVASGVRADVAKRLHDGAVRRLLAHEATNGDSSAFPAFVHRDGGRRSCRTAWCYGDIGVAGALLSSARAIGDVELERTALRIARSVTRRLPETFGVNDASLCHGSAGLAHVFSRMHRATGDEACAGAAKFWLEETLRARRPGESGGFLYCKANGPGERRLTANRTIVEGTMGIGLALVDAIAPHLEPDWDRLLGLSVRC